ncbi:MAG: sulfotransferase domain-containing protein [Alphaproteobacteria bacterium]|nr:sulfotransferase domain-containing protein [Alphaproteobacteria bacterium]
MMLQAKPAIPACRRARTPGELRACFAGLRSDESLRAALSFVPVPTDVFVSTWARCGTTWTQQIVHGLRTGGDMGFSSISVVVPWLESAVDMGLDPNAPQVAAPRAFKTHLREGTLPKGGRRLAVVRDPADVLVSYYHFLEGWLFEPGSISLDAFTREVFLAGAGGEGGYYGWLVSWLPQLGAPDTLFHAYEDYHDDLPGCVQRIARFMDCDGDDGVLDVVIRQASMAFMRTHRAQFDDRTFRVARAAAMGLPNEVPTSILRAGRRGDGAAALSPALNALLEQRWAEVVAPRTGLRRWADVCQIIHESWGTLP